MLQRKSTMRTLARTTLSQKSDTVLLPVSNHRRMNQDQSVLQSYLSKNHDQYRDDTFPHSRFVRFSIYAGLSKIFRTFHHPLLVLYGMFYQCNECVFLFIETKVVAPN